MHTLLRTLAVAGTLTVATQVNALPITLDFEDLFDGDDVASFYEDVTFTQATVLTAGISLNEFEFPPASGTNVIFDDGGPISVSFASPVTSFSVFITYASPVVLSGFDAFDVNVVSTTSNFVTNLALSGDIGSSPNELLSLTFAAGFSRVTIAGDLDGGSFTADDVVYQFLVTSDNGQGDNGQGDNGQGDNGHSVSEPPALLLAAVAFVALLLNWTSRGGRRADRDAKGFNLARATSCFLVMIPLVGHAQPPQIGLPTVSPPALTVNATTQVRVSAIVRVPNVIPGSVNVQRIEPNGRVSVLGYLNDDGLDGDLLAGDGIFAGTFQVHEFWEDTIGIRVSAAARGSLRRIVSAVYPLSVLPEGAPVMGAPVDMSKRTIDPVTGDFIIADQVIACFDASTDYAHVVSISQFIGATVHGRLSFIGNCYQFRLSSDSDGWTVAATIDLLHSVPGVLRAEPDGLGQADGSNCMNPTEFDSNFLHRLRLPTAHQTFGAFGSGWGQGVTVAVLDSGVAFTNNDVEQCLSHPIPWILGTDFIEGDPFGPDDTAGHGTHVASIIKATAPDVRLYFAKVIHDEPHALINEVSMSGAVNAMFEAKEAQAKIVNASWSTSSPFGSLNDAVKMLQDGGVVVVASAGNKNNDIPRYPASFEGVISVGAVDFNHQRWEDLIAVGSGSNFGEFVDMAAPGVDIKGFGIDGMTLSETGTSFAVPFVTGTLALIMSKYPVEQYPSFDPVKQILDTAMPIPGGPGPDMCPDEPCNQGLGAGSLAPLAALGAMRFTRNTAWGAGTVQSTDLLILNNLGSSSQIAYQSTLTTSGQGTGCELRAFPCIVDIPFDFSSLPAGEHAVQLRTQSTTASTFATVKLNAPGVRFTGVEVGSAGISDDQKSAVVSLFGFNPSLRGVRLTVVKE